MGKKIKLIADKAMEAMAERIARLISSILDIWVISCIII